MDGTIALSRDALEEFKRIYQAEFGEALTDAEAQVMGLRLLRVFDLLNQRSLDGESEDLRP
jgi:hypothetical protein